MLPYGKMGGAVRCGPRGLSGRRLELGDAMFPYRDEGGRLPVGPRGFVGGGSEPGGASSTQGGAMFPYRKVGAAARVRGERETRGRACAESVE